MLASRHALHLFPMDIIVGLASVLGIILRLPFLFFFWHTV
jgi:hypothetical protein